MADGQTLDVEPPSSEQAHDTVQDAGVVLDEGDEGM
jgi:hypothetical protein